MSDLLQLVGELRRRLAPRNCGNQMSDMLQLVGELRRRLAPRNCGKQMSDMLQLVGELRRRLAPRNAATKCPICFSLSVSYEDDLLPEIRQANVRHALACR